MVRALHCARRDRRTGFVRGYENDSRRDRRADSMSEAESAPEQGGGDSAPGESQDQLYIAIDGITEDDLDSHDVERLRVDLLNLLLADHGLPIEGVRIVQEPNYVVEFTDE